MDKRKLKKDIQYHAQKEAEKNRQYYGQRETDKRQTITWPKGD
jgi:hypothetical protein